MERHCFNGRKIAEFLKNTSSHRKKILLARFLLIIQTTRLQKKQMRDFGGMIFYCIKRCFTRRYF
jgi:cystathionine beta-lyase/cystathionine gamma-synthase